MDRKEEILKIFPKELRQILSQIQAEFSEIQEIRLRAGQPLMMVCKGREYLVGEKGQLLEPEYGAAGARFAYIISTPQLTQTAEYMSSYSLYAAEDEIRQGFFTIRGGHRIGLAGRAVAEGQEIRRIKFISFLNVRVAHEVIGCADGVMGELYGREEGRVSFLNTLLISPPRMGKTTLLRDMIRQISRGENGIPGMTVGVVDERSELGACYQGVPQNDLGPRTDVMDCCPKAQGMMMLVRSMSPQVVAVDEIGSGQDAQALDYVRNCGCAIAATAHGFSLEDIQGRKDLGRLVADGCFNRFLVLARGKRGERAVRILDGKGQLIRIVSERGAIC